MVSVLKDSNEVVQLVKELIIRSNEVVLFFRELFVEFNEVLQVVKKLSWMTEQ